MHQVTSFADVASKKVALVEFSTTWCGPCKAQKGIIEKVANKRKDLFVATMDIEEIDPDVPKSLKIQSVPTTILFQEGQEKARVNGLVQEEKIERLFDSVTVSN